MSSVINHSGGKMKTGQYNLLSDAIIDEIRARIRDGVWQPGMKIPREIELSRELGISRTTLRTAMATLMAEGLLFRVTGRGTFVQTPGNELPLARRLVSLVEFLEATPGCVRVEILSFGEVQADDLVNSVLGNGDAPAYLLKRVLYRDDVPAVISDCYVGPEVGEAVGQLHHSDFVHDGLYIAMEKIGQKLVWAKRTFEAVQDAEVAQLLGLSATDPLLHYEQITYNQCDEPVEYSRVWLPGVGNKVSTYVRRYL